MSREVVTEYALQRLMSRKVRLRLDRHSARCDWVACGGLISEAFEYRPEETIYITERSSVGGWQPPGKVIERMRVEAARLMMEQRRHPIEVIARQTGFEDRGRMRRASLRAFGQPPQAIR
jgi:AraC-like DNA-binding protein